MKRKKRKIKKNDAGCEYCCEEFYFSVYRQRVSVELNRFGLCRECRQIFPQGTNGTTFETDLSRYFELITKKDYEPIRYASDTLPVGEIHYNNN